MGSLPPAKISPSDLSRLFESQRRHLNHFFDRLDLSQAVSFAQTLLDAPGAIFFSGVGKSGAVAMKLAQTLASLGLARSSFLCPINALHGDLGALFPLDILILLSKSGASQVTTVFLRCYSTFDSLIVELKKENC
jgi:arabinose-5-phosphate isomerase